MQYGKLFSAIVLMLSFAVCSGQPMEQIDKKIADDLRLIDNLWGRNDGGASVNDSLGNVNEVLEAYMQKAFVKNPATLKADFKKASKNGLGYVTSKDGNIRFYYWDTETGGTMHFFTDLAEYKTSNGVAVVKMIDTTAEGDPGCFYTDINSVQTKGGTVYMVTYGSVGSNRDKGEGIAAFIIKENKLVKAPVFHTSTKELSAIDYGYDFFSVKDPDGKRPGIHFSGDMQRLYVPIVNKEGAFARGWLVYVFDGNNYVFDKNAK